MVIKCVGLIAFGMIMGIGFLAIVEGEHENYENTKIVITDFFRSIYYFMCRGCDTLRERIERAKKDGRR